MLLAGLLLAGDLRRKVRQIEMSLSCIDFVRANIRYVRKPSHELLAEVAQKYKTLDWLSETGSGECYELGKKFCQGIGTSDLEGQLEHCDIYSEAFRKLLDSAQKQREEKERLYVSLGAFSALAAFILLV